MGYLSYEMAHEVLWLSIWRDTMWAEKYSLLMAIRSGHDWKPRGNGAAEVVEEDLGRGCSDGKVGGGFVFALM